MGPKKVWHCFLRGVKKAKSKQTRRAAHLNMRTWNMPTSVCVSASPLAKRLATFLIRLPRSTVESAHQIPYNSGHYRHVLCTAGKAACLSEDRLGGDSSCAPWCDGRGTQGIQHGQEKKQEASQSDPLNPTTQGAAHATDRTRTTRDHPLYRSG